MPRRRPKNHLVNGRPDWRRVFRPLRPGRMLAEGEASARSLLASPKRPDKSLRFVSA